MAVIIIIFLVLACTSLLIRTSYSRSKKENDENTQSFWERERAANFVRKKDISNLPYITVDMNKLPFKETNNATLNRCQDAIKRLENKKILNLSGKTNTDLKISYGAGNLTFLIDCDTNFTQLSKGLQQWGKSLYDSSNMSDAKSVLEYAIACKTDISASYTLLGDIYYKEANLEGINNLIQAVSEINSLTKAPAIEYLTELLNQ